MRTYWGSGIRLGMYSGRREWRAAEQKAAVNGVEDFVERIVGVLVVVV